MGDLAARTPPVSGVGQARTPAVPTLATTLGWGDRLGALKVRLGIGRHRYEAQPGLYRIGEPDSASPVLVTCNYRLTVDIVRSALVGLEVWLLVIDTKGVNVWCAAGKGTFGTRELAGRVLLANLHRFVEHKTLILPQLAAPGVAAHEVQALTGFRVVYGPVSAADIPSYLAAGMKTTEQMRRATFGLRDRFVLTPVELSLAWRPKTLAILAAVVLASGVGAWGFSWEMVVSRGGVAALSAALGLLAGAFVTPLLLPWLPFRAFSAKGALVGAVFGAGLFAFAAPIVGAIAAAGAALALVVISSYVAMNFTGASPITSPSGVEYEMRRAIPLLAAGSLVSVVLWLVSMFV